jgi:flagellar M-ring protein FliF
MNRLRKLIQQFRTAFANLSTPHKLLYLGSVAVFIVSLAYLVYLANRTEFVPLYSGLSESDMGAVVEALKKNKVPHRLADVTSVSVPKELLYDVRLRLASEGIPKGAGNGFEIFDQQKLGSTEFVQRINYQRALQGELARTINKMNEVMESRVHLALPDESLFVEDQKAPSAAVVLKLQPGAQLTARQTQGIVHLVASAVKGLGEDHITILSTDGQVIYKANPSEGSLQFSGTQLEFKNHVEDNLRQKIQTMLEKVLGSSRVITRVTADLDFNQTQVEQDTYDPDAAVVRSQQRSIENNEGSEAGARGNPDAPVNLESRLNDAAPKDQQKRFSRQRETVNYEINKVSRKTIHAPGTIRKLSVAVIVDGPYEMKADKNGANKLTFVGRSPEDLKSLEEITKKAVGYDEGRGDQITVSNVPFATDVDASGEPRAANRWMELFKEHQKILFNMLLTVLVFLFVVRPLMKRLQALPGQPPQLPGSEPPVALPASATVALEAPEHSPDSLYALRERAMALVEKDPEKARTILRSWLHGGS